MENLRSPLRQQLDQPNNPESPDDRTVILPGHYVQPTAEGANFRPGRTGTHCQAAVAAATGAAGHALNRVNARLFTVAWRTLSPVSAPLGLNLN
ncbi:hypothetical protein V5E97_24780 [Singulisphaera sp. Ch08]|uniref:Uncharacterized protein n=1 Tax=Singulisphaera sp. Ch08 TaxID=3120278 RepID=A0AAU7C950_9BACT